MKRRRNDRGRTSVQESAIAAVQLVVYLGVGGQRAWRPERVRRDFRPDPRMAKYDPPNTTVHLGALKRGSSGTPRSLQWCEAPRCGVANKHDAWALIDAHRWPMARMH